MNLESTEPVDAGNQKYRYTINDRVVHTRDRVMDGRDILKKAGFDPASEHVLIQLTHPGTRSIGLDEPVDLTTPGNETFRAFRSDRSYSFTVDERGYEWGEAHISEHDLRTVADVPPGKVLILEYADEPDIILDEGASVDLGARGTEHLRTGKRLITIFYRDDPFEIKRGVYTGQALAALFGVPEGYQLDLVEANGDFEEIENTETLRVKDGMHFVSHPPCGQSS